MPYLRVPFFVRGSRALMDFVRVTSRWQMTLDGDVIVPIHPEVAVAPSSGGRFPTPRSLRGGPSGSFDHTDHSVCVRVLEYGQGGPPKSQISEGVGEPERVI